MTVENGMVTRWGKVPAWWLLHPGMDADRFCVMAAMATYADDQGRCDPSQATLARHLRRSRPWVNGVVARLAADGFLVKTGRARRNGGNTSCEYRLLLDPAEAPENLGAGVTTATPPDATRDSPRHRGDQSQPDPEQIQTTRPEAREPRCISDRGRSSQTQPSKPAVAEVPADWVPDADALNRGRAACPEADLEHHASLFVHRCRAKGYRYAPTALADAWLAWLIEDHGPGGRRSGSARSAASNGSAAGAAPFAGMTEPRAPRRGGRMPDRSERLDDRMGAWAAAAAAPRMTMSDSRGRA